MTLSEAVKRLIEAWREAQRTEEWDEDRYHAFVASGALDDLEADLRAQADARPVAWAVYNGVARICVYMTEEGARDHAEAAQRNHDLSGSLAAFRVVPLYTAPPAESAGVGLSDAVRDEIVAHLKWSVAQAQSLKNVPEMADHIANLNRWADALSRTHAADGEAGEEAASYKRMFEDAVRCLASIDEALGIDPDEAGGAAPILEAIAELKAQAAQQHAEPSHADSFASKAVYATAIADAQQAEPESVIKRQAQKIGELIADRDSWIEAHARLYRLYHDQSPKAGEEIHVNVEGGDVYTLPLQASGMDKPRFVVHLPRQQQAEPVGDERIKRDAARFADAFAEGWVPLLPEDTNRTVELLRALAAQSGQRAGVAEGWRLYSADFSMNARNPANWGTVMLTRDDSGSKWWHALSDEEREEIDLFVSGRGTTFDAALQAANEKAAIAAAPTQQQERSE